MGNNCLSNSKNMEELRPVPHRQTGTKRFFSRRQEPFNPFEHKCTCLPLEIDIARKPRTAKKSLPHLYQLYSLDPHSTDRPFDFPHSSDSDEDFAHMARKSIAAVGQRTITKKRNKEMRIPTTLDVSTNTYITFAPKSHQYVFPLIQPRS